VPTSLSTRHLSAPLFACNEYRSRSRSRSDWGCQSPN